MKVLLTLLVALLTLHTNAQQLYFSAANFKDSITLSHTIPVLAKQVISNYKEPDKSVYFDNLFRYYIVARQYREAIAILDSSKSLWMSANPEGVDGIGFQFRTFIKTKLFQQTDSVSFTKAFTNVFIAEFGKLSLNAKTVAASYASNSLKPLKENFDKLVTKQAKLDTISFEDARSLVRAYNSYNVYSHILPIMIPLLAKEDNKEFAIDKVLIKTRDKSVLQAVVVRKRSFAGKLPAVLVFNIYIDSASDISKAKRYALAGYAGIVANTRGKGASPQVIEPFEHDASDAYDIISWISKQPWSNSKVGMVGGSYLGFSQWAAAKTLHPALKTIMPQVAVGIGIDYPMMGNVFMGYMLQWIHYVTNSKQTDRVDFNNDGHWDSVYAKWYKQGASFRSLDTLEGRTSSIFQRWLQHPAHDSYWQNMVAHKNDFSHITIPVLTTTGYFDDDQNGAMYYYREHFLNNKQANHYLVIGPYDHSGAQSYPSSILKGYKIDSVATTINFMKLSIEWFDYILKDSAKPSLLQDKVSFEVMGANEWKHVPSLSAMNNDTLTFYLGNTRVDQHYKLDATPALNEYIKQEVNLADRSDTTVYKYKIIDSVMQTGNALTFISQPFDRSLVVAGSFTGEIFTAINKQDMDVILHMYELMPDGNYFSLGWSLQRASYAGNISKRQLLQPGKKESIPIAYSYMTVKQLSKGSRLIVVIGINKNRDWQINYGTGKDVSDETIADANEPLKIKWFTDSYIKVPVLR